MTTSRHYPIGRTFADLEVPMVEASVARRITREAVRRRVGGGHRGLLEGIERFEPGHGARSATHASRWIRVRIQQFHLVNRGIVRAPDARASREVFGRIGRVRRMLATTLSLSRERVRQLERHALRHIGEGLTHEGLAA